MYIHVLDNPFDIFQFFLSTNTNTYYNSMNTHRFAADAAIGLYPVEGVVHEAAAAPHVVRVAVHQFLEGAGTTKPRGDKGREEGREEGPGRGKNEGKKQGKNEQNGERKKG